MDFPHCKVISCNKFKPFCQLKPSRQYKVKAEIKQTINELFSRYRMNSDDCMESLKYIEMDLQKDGKDLQEDSSTSPDFLIKEQLSSLKKLSDRTQLIRLLTHCKDENTNAVRINEDMLTLFPSLRRRSTHLQQQGERKVREDKIDLQLISDFMHEYCRVNTFGKKVKVGPDEYHPIHEYNDTPRNIYLEDFRSSSYFQSFVEKTGRRSISYTKFWEGALQCKCIRKPTMRVCVDEIETEFGQYLDSLHIIWKSSKEACHCRFCTNEDVRKEELGKDYIHPLASSNMFFKHILCDKIPFPCLQHNPENGANSTMRVFRKNCCYDMCDVCREFSMSEACIFQCPLLFDDTQCYRWRQYGIVRFDNGNPSKELQEKIGNLEEFKVAFFNCMTKYKKHYFKYKWLNHCRAEDIKNLGPNDLYIQTDYSAQPVLDSQDKLNSVGHGVCVLSCWCIIHSPRKETYVFEGQQKEYVFYECDHIRVVSPSTGKCKDQDWFLHCKIFEY